MEDIGILTNNSDTIKELSELVDNRKYKELDLNNICTFENLDGIIIYFDDQSLFTEAVDWVLQIKRKTQSFIWVLVPELDTKQKAIFLKLGANYVFSFQTEKNLITYTIASTFECVKRFRLNDTVASDLALVENDLAIVIGEKQKFLTAREYKVINLLVERKNTTIFYEQFATELWPLKKFSDMFEMRGYISNIVHCIRLKMKDSECLIKTIRGKGYKLVTSET